MCIKFLYYQSYYHFSQFFIGIKHKYINMIFYKFLFQVRLEHQTVDSVDQTYCLDKKKKQLTLPGANIVKNYSHNLSVGLIN